MKSGLFIPFGEARMAAEKERQAAKTDRTFGV